MKIEWKACWRKLVALVMAITLSGVAIANDDLAKSTSLRLAPHDADFYSTSLRLSEQMDRFLQSDFYRALRQTNFATTMEAFVREEWNSDNEQIKTARQVLRNPNVTSILEMTKEMFAQEWFFLGGDQLSQFLVGLVALQDEMSQVIQFGPEAILEWFEALPENRLEAIPVPMIVMGFRIEDQERALLHIDQLEGIVQFGLGNVPELKPLARAFERIETDRGTRLALDLNSSLIPWDRIPTETQEQAALVKKMQSILKGRHIFITIGQLDEYVILAISPTADDIDRLGDSPNLASHSDMKPLFQYAAKPLTSISYISDRLVDAQFRANLENYFSKLGRQIIPIFDQFGEGLPDYLENLEDDLSWLDGQIGALVPEFKGQLSVSYLTDSSMEGVVYNRMKSVLLDGSEPLKLLNHVGGKPLMFWTFHNQYRPEFFQTSRRIVQKVKTYLDAATISEEIDEDEREPLKMALKFWPFLRRAADIWENEFMPAMKDGHNAFVWVDGGLRNDIWFPVQTPSEESLPFPELAAIHSLSDTSLVLQAFGNCIGLIEEVMSRIGEMEPDLVGPNMDLPPPKESLVHGVTKYSFALPDECNLPESMSLQGVIGRDRMVLSYSDAASEMLAREQPLSIGHSVIDGSSKLASASYIDLGGITVWARPWLNYALLEAFGALDNEVVPEQGSFAGLTAGDFLELWEVLQHIGSLASATTLQDDGSSVVRWSYRY